MHVFKNYYFPTMTMMPYLRVEVNELIFNMASITMAMLMYFNGKM